MAEQRNPYGFPETGTRLWELARDSGNPSIPHARAAFGALVEVYQSPIRAYLRGWAKGDAQHLNDLAQGFLCHALEKDTFAKANPERGRFRDFIIQCLRHYAHDIRRREVARKRNSGLPTIDLDEQLDDGQIRELAAEVEHAEERLNKQWQREIEIRALLAIEESLSDNHERLMVFSALRAHWEGRDTRTLREIARSLPMKDSTLRSHKTRFEDQLRLMVRQLIRETVNSESEEEEEMTFLRNVGTTNKAASGLPKRRSIGLK